MPHHRRPRGFTLLEVILALGLAIGIIAMLLSFYNTMQRVRQTLISQAQYCASQRMIMDRLTNELRMAMAYQLLSSGLEGQPDQIRFVSTCVPGPAAWAVRKSTDDPIPPEQDLQIVGYRLRTVDDETTNKPIVVGLERTCQKTLAARTAEEGQGVALALLAPTIKFLSFRYWTGSDWATTWGDKNLPMAVELTTGAQPLPDGTDPKDYPFETFRRVIFLPGADPAPRGNIIRGLDSGGGSP